MSHKSTPGQRGRLYLQAHRDSQYTNLPKAHREAKQEIMRQLEREDNTVRERAMVGSDKHFDQPLSPGEREHQRNWQQEESLDHGHVLTRRRELDHPTTPTAAGARTPARPPRGRGRRRSRTIRSVQQAASANPVGSATASAAGLFWELLTAGILLSILYLVLSKGGTNVTTSVLNGLTGALGRLASPTNDLFTPTTAAKPSSSSKRAPARASTPTPTPRSFLGPMPPASVLGNKLPSYANLAPTIP